ncbi:PREDICTED: uncharacterized protein LOC109582498 [Amphimedon queenslandica]|nr:PREDICTED: uncharacterized protein LOC109582498 [Amphimedon queenslandica]|eukprot:XP_019852792.1 PREDICTED: uncharacterized protein LOC109582498 [Amphimedon queenslandica]
MARVTEVESLFVQSDTESVKEVQEEPLYEELTVLRSQFNKIQKENKELSDKLSKMKVEYLRSLSNIDSAASKVRRGMSFEIDDCKFHLEAMTRPDYKPLVDNKRIIEKLQERITLMNMELMTEREYTEKIKKDIKDHLKDKETVDEETETDTSLSDDYDESEDKETIWLYCNHPVTGEITESLLKVDKDELLPSVLDKAYELVELAPHIPIERCRLVKYNCEYQVMDQSFDLDEYGHLTIGQIMGGAEYYDIFLQTRKENETFKKYNDGGINLFISVVDLLTGEVGSAELVRSEEGWTVEELKQHIAEFFNDINVSFMRLVMEKEDYRGFNAAYNISDVGGTLGEIRLYGELIFSPYKLFYVSSDPKDYQREFKDSLMYRYVDFHVKWIIRLNITIPPGPEASCTTTNIVEREKEMKIISIKEEKKEKERKMQVQVNKKITLTQLKEELVPLIGVPPTGFIVYGFNGYLEYEMEGLYDTLMDIKSGSELIVRLGRGLGRGEVKIKLYLLQVNNTEFCKYMMKHIVTNGIPVGEFKKEIIEEAKVQGIDCVLELDKMRLRYKDGVSPGKVDRDDIIWISSYSKELYVEPLKGPEKKYDKQIQVYVIRWRPSQCSVDPIEEIILDNDDSPDHVIYELSRLSGVPVRDISCIKGKPFPVEVSCLDIEDKLDWYSITSERYPIRLYNQDGYVIYYKDNKERMKELTDKERSEIQEAEKARLKKIRECKSKHGQ